MQGDPSTWPKQCCEKRNAMLTLDNPPSLSVAEVVWMFFKLAGADCVNG